MQDCEIHGAQCGIGEFSDGELRAAAGESSPELNGKILMHAIDIVKHRRRIRSTAELARQMDFPKTTFCRYAAGRPCSRQVTFRSLLQELEMFQAEESR